MDLFFVSRNGWRGVLIVINTITTIKITVTVMLSLFVHVLILLLISSLFLLVFGN